VGGLRLPNLQALGLGNIGEIAGVEPVVRPQASYGKLAEVSSGKDSTSGHWELGGLIVEKAFPIYPAGFPRSLMERFLSATGLSGYLGNVPASGTAIIEQLGDEHLRTGLPIVYTSADSVFQIAAHEEVVPLERLYEICSITRARVCTGENAVGRVIARPFVGPSGGFTRTTNRRDFSLPPFGDTVLDALMRAGIPTVGIGKIDDLYAGRGLTTSDHTRTNEEGIEAIIRFSREMGKGLILANLVDFDTLYGHRNDPAGLAKALEAFDSRVPAILETLRAEDLLLITADHGNDPVTPSTDHSREYVPLLAWRPGLSVGQSIGIRSTFADVGKTIAEFFGVANALAGTSFLREVGAQ
jgi:phosphopentomutase